VQYLLNMENNKDEMIIVFASKDKIAAEMIHLRAENQRMQGLIERMEIKAHVGKTDSIRKIGGTQPPPNVLL
jgi:hypothetical protein